ncbi:hypothetical protein, partial [Mesorhizobium sp. M7A.F.Ca.CA.002.14.1.2]
GDAHQFHGEYPVKAGDDVLGHIHLVISSLAMRPPAGGGPVLSNEHDNGKTCHEYYRISNNINRLNYVLKHDRPDRHAPGQS